MHIVQFKVQIPSKYGAHLPASAFKMDTLNYYVHVYHILNALLWAFYYVLMEVRWHRKAHNIHHLKVKVWMKVTKAVFKAVSTILVVKDVN